MRVISGQGVLPLDVQTVGDLVTYRFTVPGLPPSKNDYDNYPAAWRSSLKHKWMNAVIREVEAQDMPRGVAQIGLSALLVFPESRVRDPQNYVSSLWNWVPDALQKAGVIKDDRAGRIVFGRDLGIRFAIDSRKRVSRELRKRTHIAVTVRGHLGAV